MITLPEIPALDSFIRVLEQAAQNIMQWHAQIMDPDRIPIAILAILLTMIVGIATGPRFGNVYPFFWSVLDKTIGILGERLDKIQRPKPDLIFRGFITTIFTLILFTLMARALSGLILSFPYQDITTIILLSLCLSSGAVWYALLRLYFGLEGKESEEKKGAKPKLATASSADGSAGLLKKGVEQGIYYAISRSSRINLTSTDDYGITRTGMALSARSFDKAMVAPVIWYLIGGLPVLFLYIAISALAWRFGKDGFTKGFGTIALGLEKLMGIIPSLFAALILTVASLFTPHAKLIKGLMAWFQNKSPAPYAQGGQPVKAIAWALQISLGGAVQDISGSTLKNDWIGPPKATAKISHKHLRQAIYINVIAHFLFIVILGSAYLWAGLLFDV